MSIIILKPNCDGSAYKKSVEVFRDMYFRITDTELPVADTDDGVSDLIVIGTDAVNDFLMSEVIELNIKGLGIRYGTDDYCIKSYKKGERRVLVLAGGRGRSTLYAVYGYFEKYADCHYFWDGDIIPRSDSLPMENINAVESPRFFYRGLRYFAHRGLNRFQAEHWSYDEWKRELDWMVKKRLNFFMLRIGMDDVWQRAFPDDVPYPEDFNIIKGSDANGYDDRSDFWTLKYRGELREKILAYARELDLMYPTDCGTMTHWYSRTPTEFLENKKPSFAHQEVGFYASSDTGKVFDFTKKENMDYYMRLTETMVENYEKSDAIFHTIGLGERKLYRDKDKNFALKLIAYRRIAENIRQRYPESKLMLASWDFCGFWTTDEVSDLFRELDPERTILLDYTSDMNDGDHSFLKWNVIGKFPYIFGLFHAYEAESELRGAYFRSDERLRVAADDPFCKGMILWPELSHSDPLVLEYLSENSWSPLKYSIEEITEKFCRGRYVKYADVMNKSWQNILPFIMLADWGGEGQARQQEEKGVELCSAWSTHRGIWTRLCYFMASKDSKRLDLRKFYQHKESQSLALSDKIVKALDALTECPEALNDPFILRDSVDIVRTVIGRFLNFTVINALTSIGDKARIIELKTEYMTLLDAMSAVLSVSEDFSVYGTLKKIEAVAPTNPNFEITLKRNIANNYCSQPACELVDYIFRQEAEAVFDWLIESDGDDMWDFKDKHGEILDKFMATPLKDMQPQKAVTPYGAISSAAEYMKKLLEK